MDWNKETITKMLDLKAKGYSASQIGKKLGCSRNAIIGKLHRLAPSVPLIRKPYLHELSYSSWSSGRYRES